MGHASNFCSRAFRENHKCSYFIRRRAKHALPGGFACRPCGALVEPQLGPYRAPTGPVEATVFIYIYIYYTTKIIYIYIFLYCVLHKFSLHR